MVQTRSRSAREKQSLVIDLTGSDAESDREHVSDTSSASLRPSKNPFHPPVNISGNILSARHYDILVSGGWFTDDLINAYFVSLAREHDDICVFSSFFYDSLRTHGHEHALLHWTRVLHDARPADTRLVLVPVNMNGAHWVLVAWWVQQGRLQYFDSMLGRRTGRRVLQHVARFFNAALEAWANSIASSEAEATTATVDSLSGDLARMSLSRMTSAHRLPIISTLETPPGQPRQQDGSSCGPFVCCFGRALAQNEPLTFDQTAVDQFRLGLAAHFCSMRDEVTK